MSEDLGQTFDADSSVTPQAQTPQWWLDERTPGSGNRPDWLPEKYKSVQDVAKAYSELERRLGSTPKEYSWEAGKDWIEPDYEPFKELADYARQKAVPQDVMDKMLTSVGKYLNEFKSDPKEEMQKLGEKATERLEVLNNWAKANFSEEAFNALTSSFRTADSIKALEEVRTKMIENNTRIPTGNEDVGHGQVTLDSIQLEITENLTKYNNDPKYREEIASKIASIADKSGYVDKRY